MMPKNFSNPTFINLIAGSALSICSLFLLSACSSGSSSDAANVPNVQSNIEPAIEQSSELIKINQVGYLPADTKIAVVPATSANTFAVINVVNNEVVMSGQLSAASNWEVANELVKTADFSSLVAVGEYKLQVPGFADSSTINIGTDSYLAVHDGALKVYYFARASTELTSRYAGKWNRPSGHADTKVKIHTSAASNLRPEGTVISAPKGWYDAGDYNKYVVNSGISTYTLLAAYEHFSDFYQARNINIPESNNGIPDILDEVKWNLDWMAAMQDPNDGGVYHKLTTLNFSGAVMPNSATEQRYVVQKGTGAALNFAAVMATASRIYTKFPEFKDNADSYRSAAIAAWQWAQANPDVVFSNPSDVTTGEYGDTDFNGEFTWAAAELFLLTKEDSYLQAYKLYFAQPTAPDWQDTSSLGYISMLFSGKNVLLDSDYTEAKNRFLALADRFVTQHNTSVYAVAMDNRDFVWGSNAVAMNKAMVLLQSYQITNDIKYRQAALGLIDYVLGKNPTDYSFVTGFGVKTPQDIHHRQSYADNVASPVPGFLAGGPQPGQQDKCNYSSALPAKSYVDDWCSYASNEVTINWNAPLVYALAAIHNTYQ